MKVSPQFPPNYKELEMAFGSLPETVVVAYGDTIYNPGEGKIPEEKIAHEELHGERQRALGVEKWWKNFMEDSEFRFSEELLAYREDYKVFCSRYKDRNERFRYLIYIASQLTGPMYGHFPVSTEDAMRLIKQ